MDKKYRKMLRKMREKTTLKKSQPGPEEAWGLYVVRCGDGSFYTGIARNVEDRIRKHNAGRGAAYTRSHRPVELVYQEVCRDRSSALIRECQVKSLSRALKEKLVSAPVPTIGKKTKKKEAAMTALMILGILCLPLLSSCAHRSPARAAAAPAALPEEKEARDAFIISQDFTAQRTEYGRKVDKKLKVFDDRIEFLKLRQDQLPVDAQAELNGLERLRADADRARSQLDSAANQDWSNAKSAMEKTLRDLDQSYSLIRSRMVPIPGGTPGGY